MQIYVQTWRVIAKSVFHKARISSIDGDWLWCTTPLLSLLLIHIQRSGIDYNMHPLSHSLTSWWPAGTLRMWFVAEGETQATKEAAVTGWTLVQGAWEQASQSAIDLCGLGGPCLWVHLPQLTDYYRLCWDLGLEKTPSTITLYGRDISNKTPISSEREKEGREGKKGFWKAFGNGRQSHFILPPLVFFLLPSSTLIFL